MQQNLRIDKAAAGAAKATHQLAAEAHVDSAPLAALVAAIATLDPSVVMQVAVKIKVMRATKALSGGADIREVVMKSRFAFIEFKNPEDAAVAVRELDRTEFEGRQLTV